MVDIQINTSSLTHPQFLIPELSSNLIEGVNTATVHLEPGEYTFQMPPLAGLMANFKFQITPDGLLDYDLANDGFLSGRGTSTLTVQGFTITLDGQSLSHDLMFNGGIETIILPRDRDHELTLIPGSGYGFRATPNTIADFQFTLNANGQVEINPQYAGFAHADEQLLTIHGYRITIDGRALFHDLRLYLMGNDDLLSRSQTHELTLLPTAGYAFWSTLRDLADFQFDLSVTGQIVLNPSDAGIATVQTQTLILTGYLITIDGRSLSYDLQLSLIGNEEVLSRDRTHKLTLMPGIGYLLQTTPGVSDYFQFDLARNGQIVIAPQYTQFGAVQGSNLTLRDLAPANPRFTDIKKVCQMTGEWDRQLNQPVFNRTESRFGVSGTDLGFSFEHNGRLWFLFGDTGSALARISSVAAVSRFQTHLELFYITASGIIDALPNLDYRWHNSFPLCGARFSQSTRVAAVSRHSSHMEVFAIGEDGMVRGRWFLDGWKDWHVLGNARFRQMAGIAAVSRSPNHMEVFAVGEDGMIRARKFVDGWDDNWCVLGNARFSQTAGIAVVSRSPNHMEVFAVGEDGVIRGRKFADGWEDNWYVLGGAQFSQTTGIAAVSRHPSHMEVFAIGQDGKVRGRWFWDDWKDWHVVGDQKFSQNAGLAAVSRRSSASMDVFGIRDDGIPVWTWFPEDADHIRWKEFPDPDHPGKVTNWIFTQNLNDSVAWTTATEASPHLLLNFVSTPEPCARYISPKLCLPSGQLAATGGFSVPISGFSANGKMYVFYSEYAEQVIMSKTYLAVAEGDDPTELRALYIASTADLDPKKDGHFINITPKVVEEDHPGLRNNLPFRGPALLLWGSGLSRKSDIYLAAVPLANVEDRNAWWFYTGASSWSRDELQAVPVIRSGQVGEFSVTWVESLGVWLTLYGQPDILGSISRTPWGPWSNAQIAFTTEAAFGQIVHRPNSNDGLSEPGRESDPAGLYGPYLIDRFTRPIHATTAQFYFIISTWNPYNTVLMTGQLHID